MIVAIHAFSMIWKLLGDHILLQGGKLVRVGTPPSLQVPHVYKWGNLPAAKTSAQPSSEMALQQVIGGHGLDRGVDVGENENAQQ